MKHGTSGVVAIPMSYRKYHNLNPGDEVIVKFDSFLLIIPKKLVHVADKRAELIDRLLSSH